MMDCPPRSDQSFGPRVDPACRAFDFTLQFEDVVLACLPAAVFLLLSCAYVATLVAQKPVVVYSLNSKIIGSKLITLTSLFAMQLSFLALRVREKSASTSSSPSADALASVATLAACLLSVLSHQRSLRAPTILSLYLSASVLLGIARTRTLWLLSNISGGPRVPAIVMAVALALSLGALVLDSLGSGTQTARPSTASVGSESDTKAAAAAAAPEQYSGFWPRTFFAWLASTFWKGYVKVISLDDLPPFDTRLESKDMLERLESAWTKYDHRARHSLLRACFRSYFMSFLSAVFPRLCLAGFTFAQPFLINATLTLVDQPAPDRQYGKGLIGAWALVYLGLAVSSSVYQYQNFRFVTRLRGGLIALLYERTLQTRTADLGDIKAVTQMGTDVERIVSGLESIHETWGSVLEIGIACWLLERQLFLACIAPIVLVLVFVAITSRLSSSFISMQRQWIEKVQERLRVTSAILGDMKAVKMLGLSRDILPVIQGLRVDEINTSRSYRKMLVVILFLSLTPINLAPMVTFAIYTIIAVFWKNETLLTAQAFTSLSLISLLTMPVIVLVQNLPTVIQCVGNFDRIQEFCNYATRGPESEGREGGVDFVPDVLSEGLELDTRSARDAIEFQGRDFFWDKSGLSPVLRNIAVAFKRGSVSAIIGPVGSGKSSFLNAMLGELADMPTAATEEEPCQKSAAQKKEIHGSEPIAYCSQQPWLEHGTIRDNIVAASPWDQEWYSTVKAACCLDQDIKQLVRGDHTQVGSRGVNLSGGQKQRIALARAIYARHSIVLLDDVFSGMDGHTAEAVSGRLLGRERSLLRNRNTTVILTTHSHKTMTLADQIVVLDKGRVATVGSPTAVLQDNSGDIRKLALSISDSGSSKEGDIVDEITAAAGEGLRAGPLPVGESLDVDGASAPQVPEDNSLTDTRRKNGELSVYKYYLASSGYVPVGLYALAIVLWVFCTEFSTIWVSWWSAANADHPNLRVGMYMGIYAMLGILGAVAVIGAAWFAYVSIISNSANKLHLDLLHATLGAPFRLFTSTDNGELLNRFSEDMELIDMDLPSTALNYTSTAVACLAQVIILSIFSRSLGAAMPAIFALLYLLQRFYLQTSRQLRLLTIEAKAPLYTHFSEAEAAGAGAPTIRAFGWRREYLARACALVDRAQRPAYLLSCVQHWLAFVLGLVMAVLAVALVATVVTWRDRLDVSAGGVGVSLMVVLGLGETLTRLIRTWTRLESSVGAVARVKRFVAETGVEDGMGGAGGDGRSPAVWPAVGVGSVEFDCVVASYSPAADPVLKGVSLSVQPGQHIAICGRSGSGKTSLLLCLLRMLDVRVGSITLDGVQVATGGSSPITNRNLSAEEVRSRVNVVPQDPFLLPSTTLRSNLDPSSGAGAPRDDDVIIGVLQRVGIWEVVRDQGGLDADVDGLTLSAGQKQLLCFARALLKKDACSILLLDEAVSSLDSKTETAIQDIIDTEFRGCTVLAVMHRLRHIASYDQVALMDSGSLVEFGAPADLLANDASRFAQLHRSQAK
ncbi:ABC transporter [Podospora appendiculata]|uniref:ABC transporter n=1 Tax=Podospora appendiculata TaxID=314037 RepID=A0AAE0XDG5_9PEZI|nr:ABC transporter [Podospora appendiculata]